jgi:hypothetical protein
MKRFAWWPMRVTSGKRIWLKSYYEYRETYDPSTGYPPLYGLYFIWTQTAQERTWRILTTSIENRRNVWNNPV